MRTSLVFSLVAMLVSVGTVRATVTPEDFYKVCPLEIPGTTSSVSLTPDGVAVTFETSLPTAIAAVRERAAKLAALVDRAAAQPGGAESLPLLFTAVYSESENGASLLLTPKNASDLEKLQTMMATKVKSMNLTMRCHQLANVN